MESKNKRENKEDGESERARERLRKGQNGGREGCTWKEGGLEKKGKRREKERFFFFNFFMREKFPFLPLGVMGFYVIYVRARLL